MEAAAIWVVIGVALAVAEVFTLTFVLLMLGAGALVAAIPAALGAPGWVQVAVFGVASVAALALLRPTLARHRNERLAINAGPDAMVGEQALVLETVDRDRGMVKIDGEIWTARAFDPAQIMQAGEQVQVMKVDGATALVWRN